MSMFRVCSPDSSIAEVHSTVEPDTNSMSLTTPLNDSVDEFHTSAAQMMQEVHAITNKNKAELTVFLNDWLHRQRLILTKSQPTNGTRPPSEPDSLQEARKHPRSPKACTKESTQVWARPKTAKSPNASTKDHEIVSLNPPLPNSVPDDSEGSRVPACETLASEKLGEKGKSTPSMFMHSSKPKRSRKGDLLFEKARDMAFSNQTILQRLTDSHYYEWFSGSLIILNAVFIGWQTQYMSEQAVDRACLNLPQRQDEPPGFTALAVSFTILFTVELLLRWVADGFLPFFQTKDISWNVMDIVIVAFSILDTLIEASVGSSSVTGNVTILRVLRVVRIVRVVKVIRMMHFFRELRMMVFSILGSLKSLLWVLLVLGVVFYVFGICFTAATLQHLDTSEKLLAEDNDTLLKSFGTLDRSILSLYMAMTGGQDWGDFYDALASMQFQYRLIFLLFISFALFAVLNIVTGVFVEAAMQANVKDRDIIVREELEHKKAYLESMRAIFEEMDVDESCCVSLAEFEKNLNDERVIAYFHHLKLDVSDARTVFKLLDFDHSGEVSIEEFLSGCYKLQGESRNLDTKVMQYQVRYLTETCDSLYCMLAAIGHAKPQWKVPTKPFATFERAATK